jgi:hypothetical protein
MAIFYKQNIRGQFRLQLYTRNYFPDIKLNLTKNSSETSIYLFEYIKTPEAKIYQSVQKLIKGGLKPIKGNKSREVTGYINFILKFSDSKTFYLHHHSLIMKTDVP